MFRKFLYVLVPVAIFFVASTPPVAKVYAQPRVQGSLVQHSSRSAVLDELNRARARKGLYPFKYDAKLTHWAAKEAAEQARRGRMGHHIGISRSGAKVGGVGYYSGRDYRGKKFITCACFDRKHSYAGAALYVSRGRTYYAFYSR